MYSFGEKSKSKLQNCCKPLQDVAHEVIKHVDFAIVHGHRGEKEQNEYFETGKSKLKFPNSKHNIDPSEALDFGACINGVIDWNDREQYIFIAALFIGIGFQMGYIIRWGGNWKQDGKLKENSFDDLGHVEFVRMLEK